MPYIIIENLQNVFPNQRVKQLIVDAISYSEEDDISNTSYESLDLAKNALANCASSIKNNAGIVEIELDQFALQAQKRISKLLKKAKINEENDSALYNYLFSHVTTLHINDIKILREDLDPITCENKHTSELKIHDESDYELKCPPLLELSKIPTELSYLLFIDYQLFHYFLETWQDYNEREPDCVSHFYTAAVRKIFAYLNDPHRQKPFITFKDFCELHSILSASRFKENEKEKKGQIRTGYNLLPLMKESATLDGIKELLQRIQQDKNVQGFMIGEHRRLKLISNFCSNAASLIVTKTISKKIFPEISETSSSNEVNTAFQKLIDEAFALAYKKIKAKCDITEADAKHIVYSYLAESFLIDAIPKNFFWGSLLQVFDDLAQKAEKVSSKLEYEFEINYSRQHAMAAGGICGQSMDISSFSADELDNLANAIFLKISKDVPISILTPHPELAKQWAERAIESYNKEILNASTKIDKARVIDNLIHELEILHLFYDVNCRTNYLFMNMLLFANYLRWTILYDPNRIDGYSKNERLKEMFLGMARFQFVIDHANELIVRHKNLETQPEDKIAMLNFSWEKMMQTEESATFEEFTASFKQSLQDFQLKFTSILNDLILTYEKLATSSPHLFASTNIEVPKRILTILQTLQKDNDFSRFNSSMQELSYGSLSNLPTCKINELFNYSLMFDSNQLKSESAISELSAPTSPKPVSSDSFKNTGKVSQSSSPQASPVLR